MLAGLTISLCALVCMATDAPALVRNGFAAIALWILLVYGWSRWQEGRVLSRPPSPETQGELRRVGRIRWVALIFLWLAFAGIFLILGILSSIWKA